MDGNWLYYSFAALAGLSVLGILITRNLLYAAFLLVLTFLGVAGLFVLAGGEFVAVTQLMIYIGGVLILLVFGIMLTNRVAGQPIMTSLSRRAVGVLFSAAVFFAIIYVAGKLKLPAGTPGANHGSVEVLGFAMLTDYLVLFEIIGLLLLVALVGAATIARFKPQNEHE